MQPVVLYTIVAMCMVFAMLYYRRRGPERLGWLIGIVLAGAAALLSPRIILLANSLGQTIALCVALAIAIVTVSVLINRLIATRLPAIRARRAKKREQAERDARLEAAEQYWERQEAEKLQNESMGVIDIEAERKRRQGKRQAFNEEYFFEESEPLEAESEAECQQAEDISEWLMAAEAESKTAIETAFAIEHKTQVTEAEVISNQLEHIELDEEAFTIDDEPEPTEADQDKPDDLNDLAIDLLDKAWKHREEGDWGQSLLAYEAFRLMVEDRRLRMEVMVEELATMLCANMNEEATDKVFEILSFGEEISGNERQQVIKALEYLQNT